VGTLVARVLLAVPVLLAAPASAAPVKSSVGTQPVTAAMPPSVPAPQEGLSALTSLSMLPRLNTTGRAGHFSSYDRTGGNADYGHPLYRDAEGNDVLAEVDRPGAISRMWFTGMDLNHVLRVYFNGEPTPRLQRPLGEIFAGTHSPFLAPLVADDAASSGGFVSYVPLEFAHSVRVTIDGLGSGYYNIDYHWYDPGTPLTTWTPALDVTAAQAQWASAGTPPVPPPGSMTRSGTVTAAAGGVSYLAELDGPGVISRLTLALPAVWPLAGGTPLTASRTAHLLNDLRLRIFWDGAATPSVDAPLGPLFSVGADGPRLVQGLAAGMTADGTLYLNFPMPFAGHASLQLLNTGDRAVPSVGWSVTSAPTGDSFADLGYFSTQYRSDDPPLGQDTVVLDTDGAGKLVGVVDSTSGANLFFLEGDERVLTDDIRTPVVSGTGTEDFFNGGWYFNHGPYSGPVSGNTAQIYQPGTVAVAAYRHLLDDAIPFNRHLRFTIEHGGVNDEAAARVDRLAYYYRQAEPRMLLSDVAAAGGPTSERAHAPINNRASPPAM
jgi:Protein of unknown function (DUF2961)